MGANLARRLIGAGHEVHLFLRPEHSPWRIAEIRQDVRAHELDLRDAESTAQAVNLVRPDWIFHLATYGSYPSQTDAQLMVRTNVFGTMNLVNACLQTGFEAFINTGSSSEYGWKDHAPREDETVEPNSDYAVSKVSATRFCQDVAGSHGVNIQTLRLYSVYGPFEEPSRFVPTLIACGLRNELPTLANPDTARDFVFVDDVVDAYLVTASTPPRESGAIYNVGTGVQTTLREAVEVARRVLNLTVEPEWQTFPARGWDTNVWIADNSKIAEQLGWQPRFNFEQGFRATVEWVRQA